MLANLMRALAIFMLPTVVFAAGIWIMSMATDRQQIAEDLDYEHPCDRTPLNQRFGYDVAAVDRHWQPIVNDTKALRAEKLFLKLDLVFPVFYGAALAGGLLLAWAWLGRPFNPGFAIAPVVIMVVADWVENLVQSNQLQRYEEGRLADLSPDWVQIASVATITKLAFFGIIVLFLFALVVLLFCRTPDPV